MQDFIWESEVRHYEIDSQQIVNNAIYLHYFDHARVKTLYEKGIDWNELNKAGQKIVLAHVDLTLKAPLKIHDQFYITTQIERGGKIKIKIMQALYRKPDDQLIAHAINTLACIDATTNRPVMPPETLF